MPAYVLSDFVKACAAGEAQVFVSEGAFVTAQADFLIPSRKALLAFIGAGGLERPRHANTAPWRNNKDPAVVIQCDSYDFFTGPKFGYLKFVRIPNKKWICTSFKLNDSAPPLPPVSAAVLPATKKDGDK